MDSNFVSLNLVHNYVIDSIHVSRLVYHESFVSAQREREVQKAFWATYHRYFREKQRYKQKIMGHGEFLAEISWYRLHFCVHFCC